MCLDAGRHTSDDRHIQIIYLLWSLMLKIKDINDLNVSLRRRKLRGVVDKACACNSLQGGRNPCHTNAHGFNSRQRHSFWLPFRSKGYNFRKFCWEFIFIFHQPMKIQNQIWLKKVCLVCVRMRYFFVDTEFKVLDLICYFIVWK